MAALIHRQSLLPRTSLLLLTGDASASPAKTSASLRNAGVVRRVFMAVGAVCSAGKLRRWTQSTKDVHLLSNGFEMGRANTEGVEAKMVKHKPFSQRPIGFFPRPAMGSDGLPRARKAELSVTSPIALVSAANPYPTTIRLVDFLPEAQNRIAISRYDNPPVYSIGGL